MLCLVAESCLTLCNSADCSPPDSSVHRTLQARILEWVAISFSRSSPPRDQTHNSCIGRWVLFNTEPPGKPLQALLRPVLRISLGISSPLLAEDQCTGWRSRQARQSRPKHGRTARLCAPQLTEKGRLLTQAAPGPHAPPPPTL